jgi:hypothetical protein
MKRTDCDGQFAACPGFGNQPTASEVAARLRKVLRRMNRVRSDIVLPSPLFAG